MKREKPPSEFFKDQAYWESVVVELGYIGKKLDEIRLIPIHLNMNPDVPLKDQRTKAGVPHKAYGDQAKRIIEDMARLCKIYDTLVEFKDGVGVIKP